MAFTAIQFNANALYQGVTQAAHGFSVGDVVRFDGVNFVLAQANTEQNAEVVGMVSGIQDVNTFFLTQEGFVSGLTVNPVNPGGAFVPGTLYYLSPLTSGALTATKPTTVGEVELPCYIAYTATSGFFFASVGTLVQSGSLFNWVISGANTVMTSNNGYIIVSFVELDMQLPVASVVGDVIKISTYPFLLNGVRITLGAGQSITLLEQQTTPGGSLHLLPTNGALAGTLELLCVVNDLNWVVMNGTGAWDVI